MTSYSWYRPAKTLADRRYTVENDVLYPLRGDEDILNIKQSDKGDGKNKGLEKRRIEVHETGEANLAPDRAKLLITYCSIKEEVDAVKHSVNRRADYIVQTLKSNGLKESQYKVTKNLQRKDNMYQMDLELQAEFTDFQACEAVSNYLIEKLDEGVRVSAPIFFHSKGKLENLRRQACLDAVRNARLKALTMAQYLNLKLGNAILIQEEDTSEYTGMSPADSVNSENVTSLSSVAKNLENNTVTVAVRVRAAFEVDPRARKKGR